MEKDIHEAACKLLPTLVKLRREFSKFPELGFCEKKTSQIICKALADLAPNVRIVKTPLETAVIGVLVGCDNNNHVVVIRADMDALPIEDARKNISYRSQNAGIMHACGHDVHMAVVIGVAAILSAIAVRRQSKTILFVFQPGEEVVGGGGARILSNWIKESTVIHAALAIHVSPFMKSNEINISEVGSAAEDTLTFVFSGRVGHAADLSYDEFGENAFAAANAFAAKNWIPVFPRHVLWRITQFSTSSKAVNVVSKDVTVTGTLRIAPRKIDIRNNIIEEISKYASKISKKFGCSVILNRLIGCNASLNDQFISKIVSKAAQCLNIKNNTATVGQLDFGAEDFYEFNPGCQINIGTTAVSSSDIIFDTHSDQFDVDELCMVTGVSILATTTILF